MAAAIKFYHNPMSRGRVVLWMLEEVGASYEVDIRDFTKREHKSPAYLAVNPMGKIPAIVHKNTAITETAAICAYLADAFPEAKLAPRLDDPARGSYYRWFFFGASCFHVAIVDKFLDRPVPERTGALGYGTLSDTVATLEGALRQHPFLCGNQFSAADLYMAAAIGWGLMTKALDLSPVFTAYLGRCTDRPAYRRADELNKSFEAKLKAGA